MFSNASGNVIKGGTFINNNGSTNRGAARGMDILMERVATGAFHNSDELYDAPKCHPHTRVAVLEDIMRWVNESESAREDFMLWLFGPAGAGKSAIAKRIAEIAAERDLLIADFFFSRISPTRNTKDRLIATLAYQLAVSIPGTRSYIEDAIERDPAIFNKNILTQIVTLLIKPFQSISSTQIVPSNRLIVIDGLDECNDSKDQVAILEAISQSFTQHKLPIKFLVVSRPELDLDTSFNCNEPLRYIHRRIALDNTYQPDDDIRLFFSDKFEHIKRTHRLRSTIPISWPTEETLERLIAKSSGQFIYASTVIKFVESSCHRPSARLNIILGVSPPGKTNPFAELDALYEHLLSAVDDIRLTLRVLSLYVMTPTFASIFCYPTCTTISPELFLSLEPGDIHLSLINLSSIVTYGESYGTVDVLHASLVDFLSDKHRSNIFYIDMASICTDFVHRILQYVKGPDGIRAGDISLFRELNDLSLCIPKGRLQSDILNFDLDAFINSSIKWRYKKHSKFISRGSTMEAFNTWVIMLDDAGLEDRDKKEALDRLNKSLKPRLQKYQSDWRLQLLLTLTVAGDVHHDRYGVPSCIDVDMLLGMTNDHDLHLVDQDALDLRHAYNSGHGSRLIEMISSYVDGDTYASAALRCMHFLSNPLQYSKRNECPEMGIIYAEWQLPMCNTTLEMLCNLLQQANTLPELVQVISNHDIHPDVQKGLSVNRLLGVDVHILAFLSRANMCSNWRIISAIRRSLIMSHQRPSKYSDKDEHWSSHRPKDWRVALNLVRQRLDRCCSNMHKDDLALAG